MKSLLWYNWRSSNRSKRRHPIQQSRINIPEYMDESYTNESHTLQGALDILRLVAPVLINFLGSSPSATIKMKYDQHGLPLHLSRYT